MKQNKQTPSLDHEKNVKHGCCSCAFYHSGLNKHPCINCQRWSLWVDKDANPAMKEQ